MKKFCYLWVLLALPISGCLEMDIKEVRVDVPINEFEHACTVGDLGGIPVSCERLMGGPNNAKPTGRLYLPGTTSSSNPMVECEDQKCHLLVPGGTMDSISAKPALIVALEPGTYESNRKVGDLAPDSGIAEFYKQLAEPSDPLMAKVVKPLIPHLRVVVFNLVKAALEQTFLASKTEKYSRIYVVAETAESSTKKLFLQTIDKATHLHPKVDLFILGHGIPGTWLFTPNIDDTGPEHLLTAMEVIEFGSRLGESRRNRIRSIFSTHCFSAAKLELQGQQREQFLSMLGGVNNPLISSQLEKLGMPGGMDNPLVKSQLDKLSMLSMTNALALAFPSSRSYGSIGLNYYPFHRDLLAFDRYYQDDDPNEATRFSTAVAWGARAIEMNLATGNIRSTIAFPKIKAKGEGEPARGPGWLRKRLRRKETREASIPPYPAKVENEVASYPFIFEGAKISGQNVQVTPVEVVNSKFLSSYFPRDKWPTVNMPPTLTAPAAVPTTSAAVPLQVSVPILDTVLASFGGFGAVALALPDTAPIYQNLTAYQKQEADKLQEEHKKNKPPENPKENLSSYAPVNHCIYQGVTIPDGTSQSLQLPMGPNKMEMLLECKEGAISLREPAASSSVTPQVPSSAK